jgi:hypothetical protein
VSDQDPFIRGGVDVHDGDVLTFIDRPREVSAEESVTGKGYVEFGVQLPTGKAKKHIPNKTSLKNLAPKFGDEMNLWVGKRASVELAKMSVRGQIVTVIFLHPYEDPVPPGTQTTIGQQVKQ